MLIGYARAAARDDDLSVQRAALRGAGVADSHIYADRAFGPDTDRPALDACVAALREGDTLVVWRLDRLARSLKHLVNLVADFRRRRIGLKTLAGVPIDATSPAGHVFYELFQELFECDRALLSERVVTSLASARARGRMGGRPASMTPEKIKLAQAALTRPAEGGDATGATVSQVAKDLDVSRSTLTRYIFEDGRLKPRAEKLLAAEAAGPRRPRRTS